MQKQVIRQAAVKAAPFLLAATVAAATFVYTARIARHPFHLLSKPPAALVLKDSVKTEPIIVRAKFSKQTLKTAREYLVSHGFEKSNVDSLLADSRVEKLPLFPKKKEGEVRKSMTYDEYKKLFGIDRLAKKAADFYFENRELVDFLSTFTPTPRELSLSILGIESRFGEVTGRHRVLNVYLTYLEDKPRRTKFAQGELGAFLRICAKYGKDPFDVKGSHGGAIGPMQFIPTSIEKFDTSGRFKTFDELVSKKSALVLVFTYLSHSGANSEAGFRIGGANYYAALAYNHSDYYARLAMELAELIKKELSMRSPPFAEKP